MRVLVTGATGFIGSALARELVATGHEVAALVRPSSKRFWRLAPVRDRLRLIEGDLASPPEAEIRSFAPEGVAHLAWAGVANRDRNDPAQVRNIAQASALFSLVADAGCSVFVGLGSQAEYGPCSGAISPNAPTRPTTLYGTCKLAAGQILAQLATHHPRAPRTAWLRLFSSYGPGDETYWMIPGLILQLLRREVPPLTLGEQRWDYIHVDDAARAIAAVLVAPRASGVFNLGSGSAPRLRETIETVRDMIDPSLALGFGQVPYRPDQVMHLEADISRLRDLAGWSPRTPLREGLRQTVEWYRDNAHLVQA
ncbi:MAG: NAD(P)-dependent oxidoreductase [Planctomycetota bacterium]|nr:NAD(P)-dependent oxidoreductase [Planctomycetota bacterium]